MKVALNVIIVKQALHTTENEYWNFMSMGMTRDLNKGWFLSHSAWTELWFYSSNKIRKIQNVHLKIVCKNLNCL